MFIELEPIFNNIGASVPFDYEMDMSDEEFWAGKPFQKAVRVKGEAVNRAGIVCIEAQATVEVFTDCDRFIDRPRFRYSRFAHSRDLAQR